MADAPLMLFSHEVICHYCRRGKDGHRDWGECKAFERAAPENKPLVYVVARDQSAAKGWRVR